MQRALVYTEYSGPLQIKQIPIPEPKDDEVLVNIRYSGICHSDYHGWTGDWADMCCLPMVGGHEGAGVIVKVGKNVKGWTVGEKAGVRVFNHTCLLCDYCKKGQDSVCPQVKNLGFHEYGTFQEYVAICAQDAVKIPENLDLAAVAPVFCAGTTAYKSLKETNVLPGQIIVLTGAGGGLGSFGIQYAKAMGMRVLAIDHPSKEEHCRNLGAEWFIDGFNTADIPAKIKELTNGGGHGVVNFATDSKMIGQSIEYVRPRGTVLFVALPRDWLIPMNTQLIILQTITIKGTVLGCRYDMDEALDFVSRGIVKIPYEMVRLDQVSEVFKKMEHGGVTSRCVIDFSL